MKERKKRDRKKENDNGIMCLPRMPKTMAKVWTVSSFIEIIAMILFFVFLLRF
jgi:flagellar biogenesis protein FliO